MGLVEEGEEEGEVGCGGLEFEKGFECQTMIFIFTHILIKKITITLITHLYVTVFMFLYQGVLPTTHFCSVIC